MSDEGYFGPDTVFWKVNQEMFSLFGGARALLMQAAHPLVSAGARQTSFYARDPWKRLIRTVQLQLILAFGSREEAELTADRVNKLHETINGIDPVTGLRYDALDLDLLLWVHATLEESTLLFYERTVRPLTPQEREEYHQQNLISAELILLPRSHIPATFPELREYIDSVVTGPDLMLTDVALEVFDLMRGGPVPPTVKPVWKFIAFAARGTLPPELQELYNVSWDANRERLLNLNLAMLRRSHRFLPDRLRTVRPAAWAERRLAGEHIDLIEKAREARRQL
ncbi:MAG: DUF2236 domain-containing protein [Acidimicrobiia bacterium]|nr:DUF2236 domain-containing protein [Acidimicrobiia bacterium]MBT8215581.1 DUF2236 domain-containing protein [Acidimicrobiia bacterium]NNF09421.1 DUF2236 domain-containing protein [Acidimicrobiia bacterium]NNL70850.1 DUF2236 domain-containing protein [Acidimicrobiia bacterium]